MKFTLKSKTFWINLLALVAALLALPELIALFGDAAPQWIIAAQAVINIALRFLGGAPLTVVPSKATE